MIITWYKRWWYKLVNGYWKCWFGVHRYAINTLWYEGEMGDIDIKERECVRCGFSPTWER